MTATQWDPFWVHPFCTEQTKHEFQQTGDCGAYDAKCAHCGKRVAVAPKRGAA